MSKLIADDESKIRLLKGFPDAEERLVLFEADIYRPQEYESAIQGCEIVFHVATPYQHQLDSQVSSNEHLQCIHHIISYELSFYFPFKFEQFKNTTEAAVEGVRAIVRHSIKSGTVRRVIYTASVVAASPLKDDGAAGFKDFIDETCWTPLDLSLDLHKVRSVNS